MKTGISIAIVAIAQTIILAVMIGQKQWTLATGERILLKIHPVDPRSLFRGDYVRLWYDIATLDTDSLAGDDEFESYDPVHVVLEPDERYWNAVSIHRDWPQIDGDRIVIKGMVERLSYGNIHVKYGIETFFVPEGEGLELERPDDDNIVDIRIAVDDAGDAAIQAVLVNDQERYAEQLF